MHADQPFQSVILSKALLPLAERRICAFPSAVVEQSRCFAEPALSERSESNGLRMTVKKKGTEPLRASVVK